MTVCQIDKIVKLCKKRIYKIIRFNNYIFDNNCIKDHNYEDNVGKIKYFTSPDYFEEFCKNTKMFSKSKIIVGNPSLKILDIPNQKFVLVIGVYKNIQ